MGRRLLVVEYDASDVDMERRVLEALGAIGRGG
jgi:hypothetical protein